MIYKLEDVCDFINGGAWSDKEYVDKGIPVLKVTNCKSKGFEISDINYLPYSSAKKYAKNKLKLGDIVIATVGSHPNLIESAAGRTSIINSLVEGYYLNQNAVCVRSKDENIVDQRYLGYHSKYRPFQHFIQMRGRGAANQMRIAIGAIKSYEFNFPAIEIQRKIGEILSAYDNLIENNQKQIKLLEEAAQRLYKEWFVDLRFPGFESTEIVDGVPNGWIMTSIGELGEFLRGKTITKKQVVEGNIPVVAGGITPAYYHNKYNTEAPVITVSASGNAGFVNVYTTKIWASDCSYLDINMSSYFYYILCSMKDRQTEIYTLQHGSAQQHVNANQINALEILKPSNDLLKQFTGLVKPMYEKISSLIKQSELASESRDRLLPKLMSGEIEV